MLRLIADFVIFIGKAIILAQFFLITFLMLIYHILVFAIPIKSVEVVSNKSC